MVSLTQITSNRGYQSCFALLLNSFRFFIEKYSKRINFADFFRYVRSREHSIPSSGSTNSYGVIYYYLLLFYLPQQYLMPAKLNIISHLKGLRPYHRHFMIAHYYRFLYAEICMSNKVTERKRKAIVFNLVKSFNILKEEPSKNSESKQYNSKVSTLLKKLSTFGKFAKINIPNH